MKATEKSAEIEALLTRMAGADRRETIGKGVCLPPPIGCGRPATKFKDELSLKEYTISGLCQNCQDQVFDKPDEDVVEQVADEFVVDKAYRMFSGAAEAAKFLYRKIVDAKGHVWLYPVNSETPAEQVHFHAPEDKNSQGYGGSTLHFELEDGTIYAAKGPWHANADSMFEATGIDIRETHRTFGCVAKHREYKSKPGSYAGVTTFRGLLHADKEPVIGKFSRIHDLAKEWADKLGHPVAYYSESKGGSSSGYEVPNGSDHRNWSEWFAQHNKEWER